MKDRLRKINRIVAVQKQLHQLAEWKLVSLRREEDALEGSRREILRFIDEGTPLSRLFSDAVSRRLKSLSEEKAKLHALQLLQEQSALQEHQRMKRAERMASALSGEVKRVKEKDALAETIEKIGATLRASFPKA